MAERGRPKGPRPEGWDQDFVAQWMCNHPGGTIRGDLIPELCSEYPNCSPTAMYQEVMRWRRRDEEFDEVFRDHHGGPDLSESMLLEAKDGMADWKLRWGIAYLEERSRLKACKIVGVGLSTVNNKLARNHAEFDAELRDIYDQVRSILLAHKEDDLEWAVAEAKAQGDARTVGNLALSVLERLDRDTWSRREERHVSGTVTHEHIHRLDKAMSEASEITAQMFGPKEEKVALPAHEEGVGVVEAEYVEVEANA